MTANTTEKTSDDGSFKAIPMTDCLGAEIRGVDLSRPLDDGAFDRILNLFHRHSVIFFAVRNWTRHSSLHSAPVSATSTCIT